MWHIKAVSSLLYHCRRRSLILSNELFIITLLACDGKAYTDGWLKMTVQWWWFQTHCSEIRAHFKMVSPCPLLWWLVAQMVVSVWFNSSGPLSPGLTLPFTYLTRQKERGTMRFILELVHILSSALALCAPSETGSPPQSYDVKRKKQQREMCPIYTILSLSNHIPTRRGRRISIHSYTVHNIIK